MSNASSLYKKLVVIGDSDYDKKSLLHRYNSDIYYTPDAHIPIFKNNVVDVTVDKHSIEIALWDTSGQEDYANLRSYSYPDTDVFLLVFAVDSPSSLQSIEDKWHPELAHLCPNVPIILVGTHSDRRTCGSHDNDCIDLDHCRQMAEKIGAFEYLECSPKTKEGIQQVFEACGKALLLFDKHDKKQCAVQ